jgi:hypothetical protein
MARGDMTNNVGGNGNGPWWVKLFAQVGVLGFLVLYLLGAIPGVRSPMDRVLDSFDKGIAAIILAVQSRDDKIERLIESVSPCRPVQEKPAR